MLTINPEEILKRIDCLFKHEKFPSYKKFFCSLNNPSDKCFALELKKLIFAHYGISCIEDFFDALEDCISNIKETLDGNEFCACCYDVLDQPDDVLKIPLKYRLCCNCFSNIYAYVKEGRQREAYMDYINKIERVY